MSLNVYFTNLYSMQVQIRFNNETHDFKLPNNANLGSLMEIISKELLIPPEKQKIIMKGKPLNIPTTPLINGSKLLLMSNSNQKESIPLNPITPIQNNTNNSFGFSFYTGFTPSFTDTLLEPQHQKIISKGIPKGVSTSHQFQTSVLPKTPLTLIDSNEKLVNLSIESDALFFQYENGDMDRIFFSEINHSISITIPSIPNYFSLGILQKNNKRWFYFLPNQYLHLFRSLLPK